MPAALATDYVSGMGLGKLGGSEMIFKRKFRWGLQISVCSGTLSIHEHIVKLAARPNLSIEETEINMKNAKTWIPGKASWETITVTFYDIGNDDDLQALYAWLAAVYNFMNTEGIIGTPGGGAVGPSPGNPGNNLTMASMKKDYAGQANLRLYDGCGHTLEHWKILDAWPQAVNFGDLDYASSEEVTVELTMRYSDVRYLPRCVLPSSCTCNTCATASGS